MRTGIGNVLGAVALATLAVVMSTPDASASTGTATISAGSLAFLSSPTSASFSATLNGTDQNVTASQTFDVGDASGSGSGWNITATSTTFTTGGGSPKTLSTTGTTVQSSPSATCDSGASCLAPTTNVSYPYTLPTAASAPTATKLYNATANTGMGAATVVASFQLAIPATTYAGTYTSTWTYSLVSGP